MYEVWRFVCGQVDGAGLYCGLGMKPSPPY